MEPVIGKAKELKRVVGEREVGLRGLELRLELCESREDFGRSDARVLRREELQLSGTAAPLLNTDVDTEVFSDWFSLIPFSLLFLCLAVPMTLRSSSASLFPRANIGTAFRTTFLVASALAGSTRRTGFLLGTDVFLGLRTEERRLGRTKERLALG